MKNFVLVICLSFLSLFALAQNGLEQILVERYYVTDAIDSANSLPPLPVGSVTYRIYADMLPGYKVQTIFGSGQHPLTMNTTTVFFNQSDYGATIPTISANNTKKNTVMIDSWLTTGGACTGYNGVPKTEDNGAGNFVNSNNPQLLQNNAAQAGIPLTTQDGMLAGAVPGTITLGLDSIIEIFGDGTANGNSFYVTNGAWACLSGAAGPIPESNKVLIAQITTDGIFHFELNIQIGTLDFGTENYVSSAPTGVELTIPSLIQTLYPVPLPPNISITDPANNSSFPIGSPVSISADATDTDGTVTQVEFFVDGNSIGIDASAPYTADYTGIAAANHVLTAKATDNDGQFTISAPVSFNILPLSRNITFIVDMSQQVVSPQGVHLAGNFNNWNTSSLPMTAGANNVYSATVTLSSGDYQLYRFVNGSDPVGYETVPAECGNPSSSGFDRYLTVPDSDTTLALVCFSSCSVCGGTTQYASVTFRVDMHNEALSANGIHIAGSFQGWQPGATPMVTTGDSVYTYTQSFVVGSSLQYRFLNGNTGTDYETVPAACSVDGNRLLSVPSVDTVMQLVCFSSCDSCTVLPVNILVTFNVDMATSVVSPEGVYIAGSFQGWDPTATVMTLVSNDIYSVTLSLPVNTIHYYRYINGNTMSAAEVVPAACAVDGNRVIQTSNDTILPLVCFARCGICDVGLTDNHPALFLNQNHPNPFNATTIISFEIQFQSHVQVKVFNNLGKLIDILVDDNRAPGSYSYTYNADNLAPGIYYYQLIVNGTEGLVATRRKMIKQ